ncbi:MAG: transglycosylase SLT domain-containing protein [Spirochaetales bacterium]|nr:transglycosylase SLT domain-containing protein [Spirochaetales bacterium]
MKSILITLPSGKQIDIYKDKTVIGRNKTNTIVVSAKYVSGTHCALNKKGNSFFIEDLNSSNGTFINGKRIDKPTKLHNNDTISLGQKAVAFQFRSYSAALKNALEFVRKPRTIMLAAVGLVLVAGILAYIFIIKDWGKIDVRKALTRLQSAYGGNIFPDDPEILSALDSTISAQKQDPSYSETLEKRARYEDVIERIFSENNIQLDFSYIAWVESHYDPYAFNRRSGAGGMWQLMPATARQYGLRVDRSVDERLDPEKSTRAAALYFKDLISVFGKDSFLLVLAAYNAGDYTILYSLKQIKDPVKDRTFWYLYKNDLIPEETKQYVLKILALIILTHI